MVVITPYVSKYKPFKRFQHKLHKDVYKCILEYTHFVSYVVHLKNLKEVLYLETEEVVVNYFRVCRKNVFLPL